MDSNHYAAVILSPHLDDAVFSCGGMIRAHTSRGERVLVLNVFTHFPAHDSATLVDLSDKRMIEETEAARILGFESRNLDETDAFLRRREYRSPARLFGDPVAADRDWIGTLTARLQSALAAIRFERLYAPLAIGWHVDHTICHIAARRIAPDQDVFFYEDAPYCLWPATTRSRLAELGVPLGRPANAEDDLGQRSLIREWWSLSRCWASLPPMTNFKPILIRPFAILTVAGFLAVLLRRHRQRLESFGESLQPVRQDISMHFKHKLEAAACYASQVKEFFQSTSHCATLYRDYASAMSVNRTTDTPIFERFWRHAGGNPSIF